MDVIASLPSTALQGGGPLADTFLAHGLTTFREACHWVRSLPYGANSRIDDATILFEEGRGTCFTKHGAIARLAAELQLGVYKNLGFYRLTEEIITGVDDILRPFGLDFVPTIHCFLEHGPRRVDLTEGNHTGKNRDIDVFDYVVRVEPESSRAELQRYFSTHFGEATAIEPRLAAVGEATVHDLVQRCHELAACRCAVSAQRPTAAAVRS